MLRSKEALLQVQLNDYADILRSHGYTVTPPHEPLEDTTRTFSPFELAGRWSCCERTIYRMINDGRLKAFHVGRHIRIPLSAVRTYECNVKE